jgi:hypothetical protein
MLRATRSRSPVSFKIFPNSTITQGPFPAAFQRRRSLIYAQASYRILAAVFAGLWNGYTVAVLPSGPCLPTNEAWRSALTGSSGCRPPTSSLCWILPLLHSPRYAILFILLLPPSSSSTPSPCFLPFLHSCPDFFTLSPSLLLFPDDCRSFKIFLCFVHGISHRSAATI